MDPADVEEHCMMKKDKEPGILIKTRMKINHVMSLNRIMMVGMMIVIIMIRMAISMMTLKGASMMSPASSIFVSHRNLLS